jgi:hypothetical protein
MTVRSLGDDRARVAQARPLLNRQGVHVGPEHDQWAIAVGQNPHDAGPPDAGRDVGAHSRELLGDQRTCPDLAAGQLRVTVQVFIDGDQVGQVRDITEDTARPFRDLGRRAALSCRPGHLSCHCATPIYRRVPGLNAQGLGYREVL